MVQEDEERSLFIITENVQYFRWKFEYLFVKVQHKTTDKL